MVSLRYKQHKRYMKMLSLYFSLGLALLFTSLKTLCDLICEYIVLCLMKRERERRQSGIHNKISSGSEN